MENTTTRTQELEQRIKELMRSPIPSNLVYAEQAIDEINELKLYFNILDDVFGSDSPDSEKLRKVEYLVNEFEKSYECWTDLASSVMNGILKAKD